MVMVLLVVVAAFGVWVYALVDVTKDRDVESRTLSLAIWTPIVFLGFAPAAIGWLVFGRPQTTAQPADHDGIRPAEVVPETSEAFRERVRARAEEQRRRYAEQQRRPE
jgi:O-antigen/teichoic acid export membrane protein